MKKLVTSVVMAGTLLVSSPLVSSAALGDKTLKSGMTHSDVKQLQEVLKKKGYFKNSKTTTYFGSVTKNAVVNFQKKHRLSADGIAGKNTYKALGISKGSSSAVRSTTFGNRTLKSGMTSSDVKKLQETLKKKGYFKSSKTTNYFGSITKRAVINFQKKHGLTPDGIVGKNTFRALGVSKSGSNSVVKAASTSSKSASLVATAKKYMNVPYVWGGSTPKGFDCSGFINYVFDKSANVNLPRTVADIYKKGVRVSTPQVGDLVFFETYKPGASHAGIYIGNRQFIHSSSSNGVSISSLNNSYWSPRYLGAKRI
ncbi:C40 family peptidase [Peribacillus glennii]|uniref:Peptidase n=1 Tax=Peribacillus glennii TaxID=2303991 RepID=A0A372L7G4_9BACI|nr:peptidoglycan-binding protein [Peribacillus glennii]RFU61164.1 peptidase [Peribacillus glennii]